MVVIGQWAVVAVIKQQSLEESGSDWSADRGGSDWSVDEDGSD